MSRRADGCSEVPIDPLHARISIGLHNLAPGSLDHSSFTDWTNTSLAGHCSEPLLKYGADSAPPPPLVVVVAAGGRQQILKPVDTSGRWRKQSDALRSWRPSSGMARLRQPALCAAAR